MFDDYLVVYKYLGDLMFYVTGDGEENELILYAVLQAFYESISMLLRYACQWRRVACDQPPSLLVLTQACIRALLVDSAAEWMHGVHAPHMPVSVPCSRVHSASALSNTI